MQAYKEAEIKEDGGMLIVTNTRLENDTIGGTRNISFCTITLTQCFKLLSRSSISPNPGLTFLGCCLFYSPCF